MRHFVFLAVFLCLFIAQAALGSFQLKDGDRVVLVGDTWMEQEQESGWLETEMAADFPEAHPAVRNLAWSGDTPAGISRASFDFADARKGFDLLTGAIAQVKPTVVILGYGMACSFDGEAGLAKFRADYERLLDTIQSQASNQVRFVILSPLHHFQLPPPLPNPARHNAQLALYTTALREIASRRGIPFVDLFDWSPPIKANKFTDNGIHPTPEGDRCIAAEIARQLGWPHQLRGESTLIRALRGAVVRKDQLFFDRWRPQNETYLFGFRKAEQGKNAHEIPEFDPLVRDQEQLIVRYQDMLRLGEKLPRQPEKSPEPVRPIKSLPVPNFTVAPGFEVNLWAEDPLLAKPIQMNFDPQGRLWVASSSVYPQIEPGQKADDKIIILEDTKGSGKADKATVFADGLFIPQGVQPGDGGCYVGQSTELLFFGDKHGRGKADSRRVVLSGFGTEDTHHMVHTLRWGPDGMLYFNQSIYIHSHIETPNGVVRLNSGGVFHLRPPTMQLDVYLRGFCNPWGHQFDPFGQSFITDGAGYQGISWGIRDATYFTYAIMRRELQSISPGQYPKFCGLEMVASQQFPDDWQGDFITADFRAHRVVRFSLNDDGAGYVTKEMPDVLTSTNDTFRPIDEKFGPDGALYIADWSNPIINHGEVDFRDPRRDHEHGRIWRIVAKDRPLLPRQNFAHMRTEKLLDELLSPNLYDVQQARRVLTERGNHIARDLQKWTDKHTNAPALLQALWMHQSIDQRDDALLDKVLAAGDPRIRAAAVKMLNAWPRTVLAEGGPDRGHAVPADCYARALDDPNPRVRLEAVRAVAEIPSLRSAELALDTLNKPMDPFLDYALWQTINELAEPWVEGLRTGAWAVAGREKELNFAFNAIEPGLAGAALHGFLKTHPLTHHGAGPWIEIIGRAGVQEDVDGLYHKIIDGSFDAATMARAESALNEASASRGVNPKGDLDKMVPFLDSNDERTRLEAIKLAGNWGGPGDSVAQLAKIGGSATTPKAIRKASFAALKKIGGAQAIAALQPLADPAEPSRIRQPAVLALTALDVKQCGPNAISILTNQPTEEAALSLWRDLLGTSGAGPVLAAALPRAGFPKAIGQAGMRAVRESGRNEPELVVALTRAASLQGPGTTLTPDEVKKLGERALKEGVAANGERIFRRQQQSCVTCHSIGGAGGTVGPDLTSVGAASPIDYLINSVLYPNKDIKDGFQAYQIETTDDEEIAGIPIHEDSQQIILRTAGDQSVTILKSRIKHKKPGGSLMPSGLADNLSSQEQLDLYKFLSELGKPGPFDASKNNVARLWQISPDTDEAKLLASNLAGDSWHRLTSLADGNLPGEDVKNAAPHASAILAGTRFRSVKTGPVRIDVPPGTTAWIDSRETPHKNFILTDLPAGEHLLILRLDATTMPKTIRVRSDDGTFLGSPR